MKNIAAFIFMLCAVQALAQKNIKYYDYNWHETEPAYSRFFSVVEKTDSGFHRFDYFVNLKKLQMDGLYEDSACKIENGTFYYLYPNGNLESEGKYIHGKKDGVWVTYHYNGLMADSANYTNGFPFGTQLKWHSNGYMSDSTVINEDGNGVSLSWFDNGSISSAGYLAEGGKPNGKWQYFHKNGKMSALETYNNGVLSDKEYYDENGNTIADTTDKSHEAEFPGGAKGWSKYLEKHLYFPDQYKIVNSDMASVVVNFRIDEEGNVQDVYVSVPFYPAFSDIAVNVIKKSPKWNPAVRNNRNVSFTFRQAVNFTQTDMSP